MSMIGQDDIVEIARFKVGDRVRVTIGIDRGRAGVIVHQGGLHGMYYGLKLDCHVRPLGYSDYELEHA